MKDYRLPRKDRQRSHRGGGIFAGIANGIKSVFFKLGFLVVLTLVLVASVSFFVMKVVFPRIIDTSINTTVVIVSAPTELDTNKILIAQYNAKKQIVTTIRLTADEEVPVIGGFGAYPLKSVYPLLAMENKDDAFIRAAYSSILGQVVDGVVESGEGVLMDTAPQLASIMSRDLMMHPLNVWSNKQHLQLMTIAGQMAQNQLEQREMNSLAEWQKYTSQQALIQPDSTCPVAVVNTTPTSGLATKLSTIVEGSGYTVIRIADTTQNLEQSQVLVDPTTVNCLSHAERLTHILPQAGEIIADGEQAATFRAKIVILLGNDVSQVLSD
jgi:hypothetical protein